MLNEVFLITQTNLPNDPCLLVFRFDNHLLQNISLD